MKTVKLALLAAAAPFVITFGQAAEIVLSFDIVSNLSVDYSSTAFDLQKFSGIADESEFLNAIPVAGILPGAAASNYEVFGFASFTYDFLDDTVDASFDLSEDYFWTVNVDYGYDYEYQLDGSSPVSDAGSGSGYQYGVTSVNDITNFLFGISPTNLAAIWDGLPESGTLTNLIDSANVLAGTAYGWLYESDISGNDIYYYSDLDIPNGEIQVALDAPISGVNSAIGTAYSRLTITASRVSDSGSTSLMAIAGIGILFIARRRFIR